MMIDTFVYLHGFLSSPSSFKGQVVKKYGDKKGINTLFFDLYPSKEDFTNMTVEKQVNRLAEFLMQKNLENYVLIGSSFGGLLSLETVSRYKNTKHFPLPKTILLLAPALWFKDCPLEFLKPKKVDKWKEKGALLFFHPKFNEKISLKYEFYVSLHNTIAEKTSLNIPIYIIHGKKDESVPWTHSKRYAESRNNVKLILVDDGHKLTNSSRSIIKTLNEILKRTRKK